MKRLNYNNTIAAISTPYGRGGLGIIRISGESSFCIAAQIFIGKKPFQEIKSHTVNYGKIANRETGEIIDEVLIIKMKGPRTFTGEDVVEISCHGGITVLKRVLSLILKKGARAADPGEFTKRAFLNGKIDLAQAEAVIDLINSKTEDSSKAAMGQMEGALSKKVRKARSRLIKLIAHIEAVVDYPEHDIEDLTGPEIYEEVKVVRRELLELSSSYEKGRIIREGITGAIIGKPNAGKSSLLNALAGEEKAIVTDVPGTTRDIIEEYINIKGIPVRLMDTAGIRGTTDPVESIGVERAQNAARNADFVIMVLDGGTGLLPIDLEIIASIKDKKKIILINKTDIAQSDRVFDMRRQLASLNDWPVTEASMVDGTGMEDLLDEIRKLFISGEFNPESEILISNLRHRQLLEKAVSSLEAAEDAHLKGFPLDFVTIDLKEGAAYLGEITGESVSEDVLNEIFSRFCIGK